MSYKTVRAGPQLVWRIGKDCLSLGQMSKLCPVCAQSCSPLCDPMDCSPPGSSVHGIFQARILEWLAISSSRGSSWLRDWTNISCIGRQVLYHWATWEAQECVYEALLKPWNTPLLYTWTSLVNDNLAITCGFSKGNDPVFEPFVYIVFYHRKHIASHFVYKQDLYQRHPCSPVI